MTWLEVAEQYTKLAQEAQQADDLVVFIAAIQRASQCVQIARNLEQIGA